MEIRVLAEALDAMHSRIRRDRSEIAHLAEDLEVQQGQMEAVVQQRTAELEEKNRELATQAASLESLANTDTLTGAASRRRLLELGERECARSSRDGRPLSVLAIDIDHFKQVNDTHGHAGGDLVLKVVVACCQSQLRNNDVLGRLGGEEFAILLPGADAVAAVLVAERIRERIAATPIMVGAEPIRITVSIGIAAYDGSLPFESVLANADDALYRAKREGRNRTLNSPPTASG
jgi:diguanylate cyclase (GGDEF)-like protein